MKKQKVVRILSLFILFGMCFGLFIDTGKASALTAEAQTEMDGILSKITGAKEFTVNRPVDNGIVLDMKDFGLSESNTPEANETAFANAIAKVKSTKAWKLTIPKGTYAVALTGKEAINLSNLSNFLLEGNGSTLIFSVGSTLNNTPNYITMNNSNTIAIQNLALDWDRSIYPIYGIGKVAAVNKTAGTVDFTFSDITVPDNAIFGGGRSWDPATNNRSETVGFQFPGGSSGISSMTKLASNKVRLTYKNAANVSSAVVGQYGQFWFRPKELVNGFRMQTNTHVTFDNLHLYTVPYQAIFSNDSEYFQIINSSVEPAPGTKERFSAYGGVEIHSVDGYFRMENCHLEGINDDNIHLSNHFFGGGVSGNPKIDNYTVALDHLAHWMHYTEVYEGATFGMRDANFNDLGWSSKVVSFTWENYFTSDGNAPWRCTVKFADPLPSDYVSTNQFWNMDKNTGNYIIRNNTFEGGLAHAMYLGLANGTVENNTVENFAYPGLILNCLIRWDRWAIGTPIQNVIIRNNTLKDCNKALRDPAAMFVGGGIDEQPSNYSPVTGRIASYVLVEGNTVETTPWAAFGTFSSKYLVIRNNQFINGSTTAKKTGKPGGNVFITNADHVVFTGNTIYHGAVSYETGINVQSSTTSSIYSQNNSVQKYVKNNGVYGDIIVDTNTYGFEKVVGSWSNSSYAGYSGTVIGSSSTGAQIRWRPLLRRGHYTVYIYKMVVGANESADEATQIEVKHKNGTYTTTMNCHSGTKGFVKLGTFEFDEGNVGYVQATRSSSTLRVSAVKFVREDECTHGAKESVVKATCTEKGYTQRACTTCGYAYKRDYTAALGHNYKYTNAGAKHNITCSRCTYSSTGNHSYTNKVCKCGIKDTSHNLYFDFKNTIADQARYTLAVYGGYNFDQATSPYWATGANGGSSNMTVNNSAGTMTVNVIQSADSAGNYGPYIETTNTSGKYPWSGESYRVYYPLNYDPSNAEYLQIRFKLTNCTGATNPRIIVCFDTQTGDTYKSYENITTTIDGASTAYQLVSIPLTDTFRSVDYIKSLGFRFRDVKAASSSGGTVVIDYIFVGKRTEMPNPLYLVTFKNADGSKLGTATVSKGGTVTYSGATPTKAADGTNHYTFKGWDKALTNITADTTITATYTATAHSYTYSKVDGTNHKCSCSCGYAKNVAHTWNTGAITTQPTCTTTGVKTYTCTACNATKTESVAAKGHTEVKDAAIAATCTTTGKTEGSHCSVCNAVIKAQTTVAATGHSYTYKATKNPTTSATGTLTGTCSKCSGTTTVTLPKLNTTDYTKTVTKAATCTATGTDTYKWKTTTYGSFSFTATTAAKGHTEVKDAAVAATCTTAGKTEGSHCSVCNAVIKAQTTVAATGHNYTYKATKNPTTSATGTLTGTCSRCSGTTTVTLPKLNTTDYTKTVTKAPTCTETGTDTYKWNTTTYGTFSFTATTAATGHSYTYKATKNPSTSAAGTLTGTCSKCSGTTTVTLPKLNTTDYTKTVTKAPTCTETGTDTYKWNTTTYGSFSFTATTAATGHSYTYKATKNPTTSATGTLTGTCSKCAGTTTVTLPKLNTTDYTKTVTKAPTCTETGTDTYKWNTTTYGTFSFTATTAALGHSYTAKVTVLV